MGIPLQVYRLVRFDDGGDGCAHHLLIRANRASYPNSDQGAEDAAEDLLDSTMENLTRWCARWWLPARCRAHAHRSAVIGETDILGLVSTTAREEIDLDDDVGMRMLDVWAAYGRRGELALGFAPDAATFWAGVEAEPPDAAGDLIRPGEALRVLFLTDRSGEGDLRDM